MGSLPRRISISVVDVSYGRWRLSASMPLQSGTRPHPILQLRRHIESKTTATTTIENSKTTLYIHSLQYALRTYNSNDRWSFGIVFIITVRLNCLLQIVCENQNTGARQPDTIESAMECGWARERACETTTTIAIIIKTRDHQWSSRCACVCAFMLFCIFTSNWTQFIANINVLLCADLITASKSSTSLLCAL